METYSEDNHTRASWIPQQNQRYEGRVVTPPTGQQQFPRPQDQRVPQRGAGQKPKTPKPMPKARTLALARMFKQWLAIASIVGFGTLAGLVALHPLSATTATANKTSSTSSQTSSSQNTKSFLKQGGNNVGSTKATSTATATSTAAPVSGTQTS